MAAPDSTGGDSVGAVQKLATTVIVGLVGLATLLVVYLANEPNRRAEEAVEQEHVAVERGIQTYIQNCVVCHGPAGEGYSEPGAEETGRIGMPLGGGTELGLAATELNQSEDTTTREERYNLIVNTLQNGRALMPAFGRGADGGALLNDEQIHELALMIQHADWDHVYNETVAELGGYPTFPPVPGAAAAQQAPAEEGDGGGSEGGGAAEEAAVAAEAVTIDGYDIGWRYDGQDTSSAEVVVTVAPGATVTLPNVGAAPHNFAVDALGIDVDMPPGETVEAVIPADAAPADYEFYCNVPGHKQAGMVGTLTVVAGAAPAAAGGEAAPADAAEAPSEGADAAGEGEAPAAAAESFEVVSVDIAFEPKQLTVPADQEVTLSLPNEGAAPHNFSIDALGVSVDQAPGESYEATLTAAAGDYEYYCNVPGHKQAGMVGTLTAE